MFNKSYIFDRGISLIAKILYLFINEQISQRVHHGPFGRISNLIDYSLTWNYVQLHKIIFILCNFPGVSTIQFREITT